MMIEFREPCRPWFDWSYSTAAAATAPPVGAARAVAVRGCVGGAVQVEVRDHGDRRDGMHDDDPPQRRRAGSWTGADNIH